MHNGNFLGTLELIAKFDPFLAEHTKLHGNKGRGHPSYLSSTICNEFINLMGDQVFKKVVCELKEAKYFSISVDSTPDLCKVDQLTLIIRYVTPQGSVERFLLFIPIKQHTGEYLADCVLDFLAAHGIDIMIVEVSLMTTLRICLVSIKGCKPGSKK